MYTYLFHLDESTPKFDPEGFEKEYGDDIKKESEAACDDRICIESDDVDLQTWFINDFSIYDNENHLLPLDSGLIEKSKVVHKISGIVSGFGFENPVTIPILDAGRIKQW